MQQLKKMTELNLSNKPKLLISREFKRLIDYGHEKIKSDEYSGILLYTVKEGCIEDPSTLVLEVKDFYPMHIGTGTYTEYNATPEILDMYDLLPDSINQRKGYLHTHHNMQAFFSSTDMSELHDNAGNYDYYLSLIVNIAGTYCAKIATVAKQDEDSVTLKDSLDNKKIIFKNAEEVLLLMDCEIVYERPPQAALKEPLAKRFDALLEKRTAARATQYANYNYGGGSRMGVIHGKVKESKKDRRLRSLMSGEKYDLKNGKLDFSKDEDKNGLYLTDKDINGIIAKMCAEDTSITFTSIDNIETYFNKYKYKVSNDIMIGFYKARLEKDYEVYIDEQVPYLGALVDEEYRYILKKVYNALDKYQDSELAKRLSDIISYLIISINEEIEEAIQAEENKIKNKIDIN